MNKTKETLDILIMSMTIISYYYFLIRKFYEDYLKPKLKFIHISQFANFYRFFKDNVKIIFLCRT